MLFVDSAYDVSIYASGNISPLRTSITSPVDWDEEWSVLQGGGGEPEVAIPPTTDYRFTNPKSTPIITDGVTLVDAVDLWDSLKDHVGASLPTRDTEDARAINDVETQTETAPSTSGTFPIINNGTPLTDVDNDGMPDTWEILEFLNLDSDGVVDTDGDGYTDLEEYLNQTTNTNIEVINGQSVEVTPAVATVNIPETILLSKSFTPSNTTNQSGVWSSNDESVATVDNNGLVTAISEGNVNITFTSNEGGFTDTAEITVTNVITDVESVEVSPDNSNLDVSETVQANVIITPSNASDQSGIWTSSNSSIAVVDINGLITGISEGATTVTFTSNDGSFSDSINVTVEDMFFGKYEFYNAIEDIMIQEVNGDDSIDLTISGDQLNFRNTPQGGDNNTSVESVQVEWTGVESGIWIESSPIYAGLPSGHVGLDFEPYLILEGTYNFIITYFSQDGGSGDIVAVDTFSLTFYNNNDMVANAGEDISICENESGTLTASGSQSYVWNTGETTQNISVQPTETTTYTVTGTDSEGNESTDSVMVTVNTQPIANAGDDIEICENSYVSLTATGGDNYQWSTGETTQSIEVSPQETSTYTVTVTQGECSDTDEIIVLVKTRPMINAGNDVDIYQNESITLTATGDGDFVWSNGDETETITVSPETTTTYSVTATLNGCSSTDDVVVTVLQQNTVEANAGEDSTICVVSPVFHT